MRENGQIVRAGNEDVFKNTVFMLCGDEDSDKLSQGESVNAELSGDNCAMFIHKSETFYGQM